MNFLERCYHLPDADLYIVEIYVELPGSILTDADLHQVEKILIYWLLALFLISYLQDFNTRSR